jgi:hypothetical protein
MLLAISESNEDAPDTTDSEDGDEEVLICEQCCSIVDTARPPTHNAEWVHDKEEGYWIPWNDRLFCNQPCVIEHQAGRMPAEPSELIRNYKERKIKEFRAGTPPVQKLRASKESRTRRTEGAR